MRLISLLCSALVAVAILAVPLALGTTDSGLARAIGIAALVGGVAGLWPGLSGLRPGMASSAVLAVTGGVATATALLMPAERALSWWPACLAVGVLLLFVLQLLRGHEAQGKVDALAAGVSGLFVVTSGAGWAAATRTLASANTPSWQALAACGGAVLLMLALALALVSAARSGWGAADAAPATAPVVITPARGVLPDAAWPAQPPGESARVVAEPAVRGRAWSATRAATVGLSAVLAAGLPAAFLVRAFG